jgi:signal transduction histidine kinase
VEDATERRIVPRVRPSTRPATVLVVEDNTDLIRFIASLLQPHYAVLAATDGEAGLKMAQERAPDIIVTDLMMPKLNGVQLIQALRAAPETENLPIIMLTAHDSVDQRIEAHEGGADAYLSKPFHGRELLALIGRLVQRQEEHLELAAQDQDAVLRVMSRGVAHEVLNPLGFILSALVLLRETAEEAITDEPELEEIVRDAFEAGNQGVERVRSAVQELREFGGEPAAEPRRVALEDVVERVRVMFRDVEVVTTDRPIAMLRKGELERVLLNLMLNATQAAGPQGQVVITTRIEGERAVLTVADDGPGIEDATLLRIFDPFFTTKDKNTGLGLALSRQIIRRHDGHLSAMSKPGKGATFVVDLPCIGEVETTQPPVMTSS